MNENHDATNSVSSEINESCLRLLTRREHSRKELLNKLLVKGFDKDDILTVIDELAEQGWQSDSRYAQSYTRHRIQKGYGPVFIAYELRKNGLDADDFEDIVQKTAGSWIEQLKQVYTKKYGYDSLMDRKEWAKRSRFLMQRGFSGTMISALFDHLHIKLQGAIHAAF